MKPLKAAKPVPGERVIHRVETMVLLEDLAAGDVFRISGRTFRVGAARQLPREVRRAEDGSWEKVPDGHVCLALATDRVTRLSDELRWVADE